jgi:hypothetical protein
MIGNPLATTTVGVTALGAVLLLGKSRSTGLGIDGDGTGDGGVVGGDNGGGLGALLLGALLGVDLILELVDVLGGLSLVVHGGGDGESGHGEEGEVLDLHCSGCEEYLFDGE